MDKESVTINIDAIKAACIGQRVGKMLQFIIDNNQEIENRKSGSIAMHFSDRTLKVEEKTYKEL